MKPLLPPLALLFFASAPVMASNYGQCILDSVPSVKNTQVFYAALRKCETKHPGGLRDLEYGAGKGFMFSKYDTPDECFSSEARETSLPQAVSEIRNVCRVMYGEPPSEQENGPWMQYRSGKGLFDDLIPKK